MFGLLNRFRRCQSGSPAVEMALVAPLFLLILVGIIELGSLLSEIVAVEKGLRAGAMIAAILLAGWITKRQTSVPVSTDPTGGR